MSKLEDEPLGGTPVLPVPSPEAQRRAHPLFSRILAEQRDERSQEGQAEWRPTPHDDPTRVTDRESVSVMAELARRKRQREQQLRSPALPQSPRAPMSRPSVPSQPPSQSSMPSMTPGPMSSMAIERFSQLTGDFPPVTYATLHDEPTHSRRAFPVMHFASGRRYDATLAFIQAMVGPLEKTCAVDDGYGDTPVPPQMAVDLTTVDDAELERLAVLSDEGAYSAPRVGRDPERRSEDHRLESPRPEVRPPLPPPDDEEDEPTCVTVRPPPFVPMVRPSPPPPKGPEVIDQETLSAMVDTSMLVWQPDGSAAFEIAFDDEVFQNLACTIAVGPSGVIATFRAPDVNTRRLLEAEAGRLRVRLSERGLKVAEVRVEGE